MEFKTLTDKLIEIADIKKEEELKGFVEGLDAEVNSFQFDMPQLVTFAFKLTDWVKSICMSKNYMENVELFLGVFDALKEKANSLKIHEPNKQCRGFIWLRITMLQHSVLTQRKEQQRSMLS